MQTTYDGVGCPHASATDDKCDSRRKVGELACAKHCDRRDAKMIVREAHAGHPGDWGTFQCARALGSGVRFTQQICHLIRTRRHVLLLVFCPAFWFLEF